MNNNQIKALADAYANAGPGKTGLVRQSGRVWSVENKVYSAGHADQTVRSLVDKGYLQLYVSGTVAHITDSGIDAVESIRRGNYA